MVCEKENLEDQLGEWKRRCEQLEAQLRSREDEEEVRTSRGSVTNTLSNTSLRGAVPKKLEVVSTRSASVDNSALNSAANSASLLDIPIGNPMRQVVERVRKTVQEDFRDVVDDLQLKLDSADQAIKKVNTELLEQKEVNRRTSGQLAKTTMERINFQQELLQAQTIFQRQQEEFEHSNAQRSRISMSRGSLDMSAVNSMTPQGSTMRQLQSLHDEFNQSDASEDLAEQNEELLELVTELREEIERYKQAEQKGATSAPAAPASAISLQAAPTNGADAACGTANGDLVAALREELATARREAEEAKAKLVQRRLSADKRVSVGKRRSSNAARALSLTAAPRSQASPEEDFWTRYWMALKFGLCCREEETAKLGSAKTLSAPPPRGEAAAAAAM